MPVCTECFSGNPKRFEFFLSVVVVVVQKGGLASMARTPLSGVSRPPLFFFYALNFEALFLLSWRFVGRVFRAPSPTQ